MGCAKVCDCNFSIGNTGTGCVTPMAVEKRAWVVNRFKADGTLNYIDLTATLDDNYFLDLINEADPLARFYPLPEIKNITDVRDKPLMFTWKDGTERFVRDGVRKYEGMFPPESASPQLIGILEGQRCTDPCKFSIDANGTIWGRISADGTKLYPIRMDAQSIAALWVKTTDTEPEMVGYSFNYHPSEKDCQVRGLEAGELVGGINPLDYDGLLDVFVQVVSCTTTALKVKLYTIFGQILSALTVKAMIVGEFDLFNVTDNSTISLVGTGSDFEEDPAGTYEFTYTTADQPVSTDVLKLTPTKNGYDFAAVVATSIVVS
jgi:hypothetical protein